jgi:hypothetical protein
MQYLQSCILYLCATSLVLTVAKELVLFMCRDNHDNIISSIVTKQLPCLSHEKMYPQVLLLKGLVGIIAFLHIVQVSLPRRRPHRHIAES